MKQTIELFLWLYGNLCLLCTVEVHCRLSMVFKLLALTILIESMFSDRLNCIHACIWTAHIKYIRIHIYTKTHAPINIYNVFECGLHMRSAYIYIYLYVYTHQNVMFVVLDVHNMPLSHSFDSIPFWQCNGAAETKF